MSTHNLCVRTLRDQAWQKIYDANCILMQYPQNLPTIPKKPFSHFTYELNRMDTKNSKRKQTKFSKVDGSKKLSTSDIPR